MESDQMKVMQIKRDQGHHGRHCAEIHEMHEDYLRPQENGSHTDCDYLILKGMDLTFAAAGEKDILL